MLEWILGFTALHCASEDDHEPTPNMPTSMMLVNHIGDKIEEIEKLKEEQRWRKWPEEKPPVSGWYMSLRYFADGSFRIEDNNYDTGENVWGVRLIHFWRPIGPLPRGEQ